MPYKITAYSQIPHAMMVTAQTQFAHCVYELFQQVRPTRIIETGTYVGAGTTAIIAGALRQFQIQNAEFFTIEVNPSYHEIAQRNIQKLGVPITSLLGLSVPRSLLPSSAQIRKDVIETEIDNIYVDHEAGHRVQQYEREIDFPAVPDDLLGKCLKHFDYQPHFMLLDSAGHLGRIEFEYVVAQLKVRCFFGLDDTNHVKHYQSVQRMKQDKRFRILAESLEKFGFCFAEFNP
jgi:hypothetical protein